MACMCAAQSLHLRISTLGKDKTPWLGCALDISCLRAGTKEIGSYLKHPRSLCLHLTCSFESHVEFIVWKSMDIWKISVLFAQRQIRHFAREKLLILLALFCLVVTLLGDLLCHVRIHFQVWLLAFHSRSSILKLSQWWKYNLLSDSLRSSIWYLRISIWK